MSGAKRGRKPITNKKDIGIMLYFRPLTVEKHGGRDKLREKIKTILSKEIDD